MTIKEAIKKAENEYKGLKVCNALELENSFVLGFCGANNEPVDISPCSVDKGSGKISEFFPPEHLAELENAKEIDLTTIK